MLLVSNIPPVGWFLDLLSEFLCQGGDQAGVRRPPERKAFTMSGQSKPTGSSLDRMATQIAMATASADAD